ncbi:hypothetical protein ACIBG8_22795 [Nonomuraea sp. NPDC050556]|uniref:hypothetical protein n=1 Tax=Nonomuraea sp. NPDC050556 TaxID=3364369 RepID=UPI0037A8F15D
MRTVLAVLALMALAGCSAPPPAYLLTDPATWPLAKLDAVPAKLPDTGVRRTGVTKAIATIEVGGHDLVAWVHTAGVCGLSDKGGTSMWFDLTTSEGQTGYTRDAKDRQVFRGPDEPMVAASSEGSVMVSCGVNKMLVLVTTGETSIRTTGSVTAKVVHGQVAAVIADRATRDRAL